MAAASPLARGELSDNSKLIVFGTAESLSEVGVVMAIDFVAVRS